ncbi:thioredoxin family protein [Olivibacter sp. SDN3]|uniref:thioredoxin family protein n=1 Tax=Olivibacter sp. SDN3 TaxID=2764720 RepID=UPI0016519BEC|nr:thioredoxin family protein [Olivibacter sp. SDN3]QNL52207.1 thioredoxin family protein [Olivibacter sp. SDN3]
MDIAEKIKSDKPTLVNFHAVWCGPCHMMKPNIEEAATTLGDKIFYEWIDIDEHQELAQLFQIRSVPTTIIFKDGEVKWRQSGIFPANEIVRLVEENIEPKS